MVEHELFASPVASWGEAGRLVQALQKPRNSSLQLVTLGGSITACHGPANRSECYVKIVARWLAAESNITVNLTNSAVPATTSLYSSQCVNELVPKDADVVMVRAS